MRSLLVSLIVALGVISTCGSPAYAAPDMRLHVITASPSDTVSVDVPGGFNAIRIYRLNRAAEPAWSPATACEPRLRIWRQVNDGANSELRWQCSPLISSGSGGYLILKSNIGTKFPAAAGWQVWTDLNAEKYSIVHGATALADTFYVEVK